LIHFFRNLQFKKKYGLRKERERYREGCRERKEIVSFINMILFLHTSLLFITATSGPRLEFSPPFSPNNKLTNLGPTYLTNSANYHLTPHPNAPASHMPCSCLYQRHYCRNVESEIREQLRGGTAAETWSPRSGSS